MSQSEPSSPLDSKPNRAGRARWLVLAAALLVRGAVAIARIDSFDADPDAYRAIAQVFARHGVFGRVSHTPNRTKPTGDDAENRASAHIAPTAYRPPLYPLLLTPLVGAKQAPRSADAKSDSGDGTRAANEGAANKRAGNERAANTQAANQRARSGRWSIALLHVILGVATVDMVLRAGRLLGGSRSAILAALATAVDPVLVFQSTVVMTETLAALLAMSALLALIRLSRTPTVLRATLAGLAIGLASLCRPTFLPWAPLVALGCVMLPVDWRRRIRLAAIVLLASAAVLAPWTIRNRLVFGRWIATTTHGGYTLLLGNNPEFYQFLRTSRAGDVWNPPDGQLMASIRAVDREERPAEWRNYQRMSATEQEVADDERAYRFAWRYVAADRVAFARACLYRLGQFWSPLPHARSTGESTAARGLRYFIAAWYVVIGAVLSVGAIRLGRNWLTPPWLWTLLLVASFAAAHVLYWSNLRMRGPITPALTLLLVAVALRGRESTPSVATRPRVRNKRSP